MEEMGLGEAVILTLADKRILADHGGDIADEEDELENVLKVGVCV